MITIINNNKDNKDIIKPFVLISHSEMKKKIIIKSLLSVNK